MHSFAKTRSFYMTCYIMEVLHSHFIQEQFLYKYPDPQIHQDILDECIFPTVAKGTITVLFIFTYKILCFLACKGHS